MQSEVVFVEPDADFGEKGDKGEIPLQFDEEEDKGETPIKKRQKIQARRPIKRFSTCKSPFINDCA